MLSIFRFFVNETLPFLRTIFRFLDFRFRNHFFLKFDIEQNLLNMSNDLLCNEEVQHFLNENPSVKIKGSISSLLMEYSKIRLGPVSTLTDIQLMDVLGNGYGQLYLKKKKEAKRYCAICKTEKSSYGDQFLTHCKSHASKRKSDVETVRVDRYGK